MKLKVYITIVIFIISTNGIPLYLHLCSDQGLLILNSCEKCSSIEKIKKPVCHSPEEDYNLKFTDHNIGCCEDTFIKKLDDEFIGAKAENHHLFNKVFSTIIILPINIFDYKSFIFHTYCDSSPPHNQKIDLNIFNSILLI